jgi:hypothetical protein
VRDGSGGREGDVEHRKKKAHGLTDFDDLGWTIVALYLDRRLRSQAIHDLNEHLGWGIFPKRRAALQAVLVAQLQAERFLLLEQRHGCPKPAPGFRLWKDLTDGSISDKILSSIRTALISIRSFSLEPGPDQIGVKISSKDVGVTALS